MGIAVATVGRFGRLIMLAMARAIQGTGSESLVILPADNLPEPLHGDDYDRLSKGTPAAYMQKRGKFDFPNIRRMSQLQYWTVKPIVKE